LTKELWKNGGKLKRFKIRAKNSSVAKMSLFRKNSSKEVIEQEDPYKTLKYLSLTSLPATRVDEGKKN